MTRRMQHTPRKAGTLSANSHEIERHRRFTLVEVMISVVLLALVSSLAVPSYHNMVEKRLLVRNVELIATFLDSVQSISTFTNQAVTVHYDRDGHTNWCIGASADTSPDSSTGDCDCEETNPSAGDFCAIDGLEYRLDDDDTDDMRLMHSMKGSENGDKTYTIDPTRGILWDSDDSLDFSMHHDESNYHLNIEVSSAGKVIICSRSSNEAIAGYEVCS